MIIDLFCLIFYVLFFLFLPFIPDFCPGPFALREPVPGPPEKCGLGFDAAEPWCGLHQV